MVYAHRAGASEHRSAQAAIERAAASSQGWGFTVANINEFWRVVTEPRMPQPSSGNQAYAFILELIEGARARVWYPKTGFAERLLQAASDLDIRGARIFDLHIGLCARENGATHLWTRDARFIEIAGLEVVNPF
ncbi:MAG: PIN domain-containing protein [Myxococcales bacterium]|nr:PIN domain-containing protein [Myxococcales bacterium]